MSRPPAWKPDSSLPGSRTFAAQATLPKLPIPPLEDTCRRYLKALEALQDEKEHALTKKTVKEFLEGDGPHIQEKLREWAKSKDRYVVCVLGIIRVLTVWIVISKISGRHSKRLPLYSASSNAFALAQV